MRGLTDGIGGEAAGGVLVLGAPGSPVVTVWALRVTSGPPSTPIEIPEPVPLPVPVP